MEFIDQLININREIDTPIYLQVCDQLIQLIQEGRLGTGTKLLGSRKIATQLGLHRNTVVKAMEELEAQGWINIVAQQGAYVVEDLPVPHRKIWRNLPAKDTQAGIKRKAKQTNSFQYYDFPKLIPPYHVSQKLAFDDGAPDPRLAPIRELGTAYASNMKRMTKRGGLHYNDGLGHPKLREALTEDLRQTRGIQSNINQIIITRGTVMAIRLASEIILRKGDGVIVGESNYQTANLVFTHLDADLHTIPVDEKGIVVNAIPSLCKKYQIRLVYVTSHHHHPTTVTLSAERRMQLLQLAEQYNFVVLEDDYDFEFHYANRPILPLASLLQSNRVFYCGSFTKAIAPAFRVGYLVAPSEAIELLPKIRRLFDRQGAPILEAAIADLLIDGTIRRYLKKALKAYRERRDYFCTELENHFSDVIHFDPPSGGMAIWAKYKRKISLSKLSLNLKEKDVFLSNGKSYNPKGKNLNATRMGFARMNQSEMEEALETFKAVINKMK